MRDPPCPSFRPKPGYQPLGLTDRQNPGLHRDDAVGHDPWSLPAVILSRSAATDGMGLGADLEFCLSRREREGAAREASGGEIASMPLDQRFALTMRSVCQREEYVRNWSSAVIASRSEADGRYDVESQRHGKAPPVFGPAARIAKVRRKRPSAFGDACWTALLHPRSRSREASLPKSPVRAPRQRHRPA